MHIFKFFLLIASILYSQQVHLKLGQNENIVLSEDSNVEGYLDSLIKTNKDIHHSYKLVSVNGMNPIKVQYIENHELIYIDTIFIKDSKEVNNQTYQSLLRSLLNISSEKDLLQQIKWLESSHKFLQNSIHFAYGKTNSGGFALLLDIIPKFENNVSGLIGANRVNNGDWITNGEIELNLENIWSTASNSLFHWKRLNEKSEIISFLHYEPTLWNLPFGLQIKLDKELRDKEYISQYRDLRIFSNLLRYGKWFFGSKNLTIIPSDIGYASGLIKHRSSSILLGLINDTRNHRWIPTNGYYWNISLSLGKQTEDNIANLKTDLSLNSGIIRERNSFLSYHINFYIKGVWVENGNIHKGQKFRYGGVNNLRGYRDDQFISSRIIIPSIEILSNIRNDLQLFGFMDSAIQKEYTPYPLGFGIGIKQVSRSSIINATIGFGRGEPISEAKLHIKFSSRI